MTQGILIIDDSSDVHDLLDVRLKPEGLMHHHALDGEDGMARAALVQPDLILLDVDMPGMSGFEVCRRLKAEPKTSEIPIIFLTAADQLYAKVEGFDLGAVDYVTKPFEAAELRARVRAALRTKRYHDLLSSRAQVDGLTTLWNRSYFDRRLTEEVHAALRYKRVVSLVMADVDHFKKINDTFGHPFGDFVLARVGEALSSTMRACDAPCRYGGEEFACILTDTSLEGALIAAERIRAELHTMALSQRGQMVRVTASFGVASTELFEPGKVSVAALVGVTDDALFAAKRAGRDCVARGEAPAVNAPSP